MATWKKIITSGSAAELSSLTLDTDLAVAHGGTGQGSYTDGQLLIGNSSGNTLAKATLTGTANEIGIANGNGSITIGLTDDVTIPQDLTVTRNISNASAVSDSHLTGSFTGSFVGDGSNLTGVGQDIDTLSDYGAQTIAQTDDHFLISDNGTEKKITFSDLEDSIFANVSGDATIAGGGALTIAANAVEGSMLNSNVAGTGLTYAGSNIDVALNTLTSHTIGAGTSEITIGDNLTVTGDLTVNGDRNIVSTTNLLVEDKFITIASGSTSAGDGGIVVQTAANGDGAPLAFDSATRRWALGNAGTLSGVGTTFDSAKPQFDYIVGVSGSANDPAAGGTPTLGTTNHYYGQMHVNTTTGDIFIYS